MNDLKCICCYYFGINNDNLKLLRKFLPVSVRVCFMSSPLAYALAKVLFYKYISLVILVFCLYKLCNDTNNDLLSEICSHCYVYTYVHRGDNWHRNKLSRCKLEILVSCSNDQHQTSLKWDRSSHPFAPTCRFSHTLRLKMFTIYILTFCESCSLGINVPAEWHAGCNCRCR